MPGCNLACYKLRFLIFLESQIHATFCVKDKNLEELIMS